MDKLGWFLSISGNKLFVSEASSTFMMYFTSKLGLCSYFSGEQIEEMLVNTLQCVVWGCI